MNEEFYKKNEEYSSLLDSRDKNKFNKYADTINNLGKEGLVFLDVGCGTGIAVSLIDKKIKAQGIEISLTSIEKCKRKNLHCSFYNGKEIPYKDNSCDIVGSYNVLEHVDDPYNFLDEKLRVLRKGGHLVIACPNFLSITNSYHHHTRGIFQKTKNFFAIMQRLISSKYCFEKMEIIVNPEFKSDDDACNITNPIDILKWARNNQMKMVYWSSSSVYRTGIINYLDKGLFKAFLGSSFFVFQKK